MQPLSTTIEYRMTTLHDFIERGCIPALICSIICSVAIFAWIVCKSISNEKSYSIAWHLNHFMIRCDAHVTMIKYIYALASYLRISSLHASPSFCGRCPNYSRTIVTFFARVQRFTGTQSRNINHQSTNNWAAVYARSFTCELGCNGILTAIRVLFSVGTGIRSSNVCGLRRYPWPNPVTHRFQCFAFQCPDWRARVVFPNLLCQRLRCMVQ